MLLNQDFLFVLFTAAVIALELLIGGIMLTTDSYKHPAVYLVSAVAELAVLGIATTIYVKVFCVAW